MQNGRLAEGSDISTGMRTVLYFHFEVVFGVSGLSLLRRVKVAGIRGVNSQCL